jgi:type III pantothenate kinase
MLLAIDVGNTNIVAGLFKEDDLQQRWRISTNTARSADEYRALFHILAETDGIDLTKMVDAVVIGSVVPSVTSALHNYCHDWLDMDPLHVHVGLDLDMAVLVREPKRVGVDRLLNAIAARSLFGAPCITLDLGTATKFDVVDACGSFVGGAIAPGFHTASDALVRGTALLPRIDLETPPHPIGDDTTSAMQSGIVLGYVSLIEGMLARIQAVLPESPVTVIATGGLASLAVSLSDVVDHYEPDLTLYGLRIVFEQNKR